MSYEVEQSAFATYSRDTNRLGILSQTFDQEGGMLRKRDALVEFKLTLSELYEDRKKVGHAKDLSDIDLLVCWSVDTEAGTKHGDIVSEILPSQRFLYGSTHRIITPVRKFELEVMSLKDVIDQRSSGTPFA
jgi:hypothetical protein